MGGAHLGPSSRLRVPRRRRPPRNAAGRARPAALTGILLLTSAVAAAARQVPASSSSAGGHQLFLFAPATAAGADVAAGSGVAAGAAAQDAAVPPLERPAGGVEERRIAVDLAALAGGAADPRLTLLDGRAYATRRTGLELRGEGDFTWRGLVLAPDGGEGTATLTVAAGKMAGRIVVPGGAYEVVPAPDGSHRLRAIDATRSLRCDAAAPPPELLARAAASAGASGTGGAGAGSARVRNDTAMPTRVDVMVLYDAAALAGAGGPIEMRLLIQNAVDVANSSYIHSNVDLRVALVHVAQVEFQESGDLAQDVRNLAQDQAIAALRQAWGADLVSLVVENADTGNRVGYSFIMAKSVLSPAFAPLAFSVVRRELISSYLTLAHEMAHNMGCEHDPADAVDTPEEASYPWSFGHYVDGLFRTVMSYPNPCANGCPLVESFSNPDVAVAGLPTGIADQRDNHRTLNATRDLVAGFMSPQGCRPGPGYLCLLGGRFEVEVAWENQFNGTSGSGLALPRTDESGFFAFADPGNVELLVKILDFGTTIKLFYGELTDLEFALIVTDTANGLVRYYANTPGDCGAVDPAAFPSGSLPPPARPAVVAGPGPGAQGCSGMPDALCLLGGRFAVTGSWRNQYNGTAGAALPVSLGSDLSGAFYFADPGNLELVVKVIDFGDRIAVFYGTLSDLDYTITVADLATGRVKTYHNPAGHFCGGLDNTAF